ncbi:MAG: putative 2-aminoethylphosphonate ABC transporter ATP-binding protein [Pseudomonadota bacterium]
MNEAIRAPAALKVGTRPYLKIDRLSKKFGTFTALEDVSFEVSEGEFMCFLGPSGCGKTTLLRAIAGLDIQTAGRIEQAGCDISALPPAARDFGIVFQSYALFPNLTVYKNVAYGLENRRQAKAEVAKRVAELLALVGMPEAGPKYPAQLSGGQQQRVALARALATSPGLLLLDEPLSALDARVRVHLRHEIKMLQRRLGVTTIMVTHDQEEALTMADRIVVMNQGVIEQVGTPVEIYRQPASAFAADFVGTMNFLPGTMLDPGRVRLGKLAFGVGAVADGLTPGQPVMLCVRPEDVAIRNLASGTPNAFEARISGLEFLGSFYRARLRAPDIDDREILADFSINAVRDLALSNGMILRIALPSERLGVFAGA